MKYAGTAAPGSLVSHVRAQRVSGPTSTPSGSSRGAAVAELIDFYYRPEIAARVAAWVNYICPVEGAQAQMQRIDPDLALSPLIFPDTTILDRSYQFPALGEADDKRLRDQFNAIAG